MAIAVNALCRSLRQPWAREIKDTLSERHVVRLYGGREQLLPAQKIDVLPAVALNSELQPVLEPAG